MITTEYILANDKFKPEQAVDRAAGYDVKAYIPDAEYLDTDELKEMHGVVFINGKLVNKKMFTEKGLTNIEEQHRFVVVKPGEVHLINTGFKVGLSTDNPNKIATMLVCPRSGLALKGITVINAPGVVDEHYPDWVKVALINHSVNTHLFSHGSRIAQVMFVEVENPVEKIVEEFTTIGNRQGGFGSTGN